MIFLKENIKAVLVLICVSLVLSGSVYLYNKGYSKGEEFVQSLWNKDKVARDAAIKSAEKNYQDLKDSHSKESRDLELAFKKEKIKYEEALNIARTDYTNRLRSSETRSAIYKRQAEAGSAQCGDLANHTTELDRTLEEGRGLVREFRETLRQRDREVELLLSQIKLDRRILEDSNE